MLPKVVCKPKIQHGSLAVWPVPGRESACEPASPNALIMAVVPPMLGPIQQAMGRGVYAFTMCNNCKGLIVLSVQGTMPVGELCTRFSKLIHHPCFILQMEGNTKMMGKCPYVFEWICRKTTVMLMLHCTAIEVADKHKLLKQMAAW